MLGALVAGAALLFAGAAARAADEAAIVALPADTLVFATHYLAEDLGFFAKEGLAVKTVRVTGVGAFNALVAGSADFSYSSALTITRAAARGQHMLAIADLINRPIMSIVVGKAVAEAGHLDPKAPLAQRAQVLKGKTLSADSVGSITHAFIRLVAKRAGLDPEGITFAPMQTLDAVAALKVGRIDGFSNGPPWPQLATENGTGVMVATGTDDELKDLSPLSMNLLVTRPSVCEQRRSVCEKMARALTASTAFMHARQAEARALLKKRFPQIEDAVLARAYALMLSATPDPPIVVPATLENAERLNIEAGLLRPADKLGSYADLFSSAFVK
jgi:ABC-type nitrate/sulfonate/bicarbonate transport system substrate-binding protein